MSKYIAMYEYDDGDGGGLGDVGLYDDMGEAVRAAVLDLYSSRGDWCDWYRVDVHTVDAETLDEAHEEASAYEWDGDVYHASTSEPPALSYEMHEDGAGALYVYACVMAGPSDEPVPVWGARYYGERDRLGYTGEEYAGMDWAGLVAQGIDPLREGWEGMPSDELARCYGETCGDYVALSEWDGIYPLGLDVDCCGEAGRLAAIATGAAYRCPECGEVLPTVRDVRYPDTWATPPRCECCGAALEP